LRTDLFTLNKYLGMLAGALIGYIRHGGDTTPAVFGAAFGYGLSFLITIIVIFLFDGRKKLSEFQYALLSRERFLFSFKSDKYMYIMVLIYMIIFSLAVKFYNPELTAGNAAIFGFLALSFFSAASLIIHANLLLLTAVFVVLACVNAAAVHSNSAEFLRQSEIVTYFPLSFFFVAGYIEEYKRLEYRILALIFDEKEFDDLAVTLFKLEKPSTVNMPPSSFIKAAASGMLWIILLSSVKLDFAYFSGFLSAIKN